MYNIINNNYSKTEQQQIVPYNKNNKNNYKTHIHYKYKWHTRTSHKKKTKKKAKNKIKSFKWPSVRMSIIAVNIQEFFAKIKQQ